MTRRGPYWRLAILLAFVGAVYVFTRGTPPTAPRTPGSFTFAVLGDAPYSGREALQYRLVLEDMQAHDLDLVLHVGDILWRPCSDERFRQAFDQFQSLRHPVVYTPGDNEWADCWDPQLGGYQPLERLASLRRTFFGDPTTSLGGSPLALDTQSSQPAFAEYVEHARWSQDAYLFATLHLVGSRNARANFPGRSPADDAEVDRRTAAATAWLRETFAQAASIGARAVVLALHANPGWNAPPDNAYRRSYEPFIETLEEEVARFEGPVLLVQGDDHEFVVDQPLVSRSTGARLTNLTRMQVPGSPQVGWVRAVITPGDPVRFAFESRIVPMWKHW
jgi:hypothetical protein